MNGWDYRRAHTLAGSADGDLTSYQMDITVHRSEGVSTGSDLYVGQRCRDDFADLRFTTSDGITPIAHHLVNGQTLRLQQVVATPDAGKPYCSIARTGKLTTDAGNQRIIGWGTQLTGTITGVMKCYDQDYNILWSWQSTSPDYIMGAGIGDIRNIGRNDVAAGTRLRDQKLYLIDGLTGTTVATYTNSTDGTSYIRGVAVGKVTSHAGKQVVIGDASGDVAILRWNGSTLVEVVKTNIKSGNTPQTIRLVDVDNDGLEEICVEWGNHTTGSCYTSIYDNTLTLIAEYHHINGTTSNGLYGTQGADPLNPNDWCFAYATQNDTPNTGFIGLLRYTGSSLVLLWQQAISHFEDPSGSPDAVIADVDNDGELEICAIAGLSAAAFVGGGPPYYLAAMVVFDLKGRWKYTMPMPGYSTVIDVGDIHGDGFDECLVCVLGGYAYVYGGRDNDSALFTLNVPSIPTGGTTIYVYYGNLTAVSESNSFTTYISYDDMTTPALWTVVGGRSNFYSQELGYFLQKGGSLYVDAAQVSIDVSKTVDFTFPRKVRVYYLHDITDTSGNNLFFVANSARTEQHLSIGVSTSVDATHYVANAAATSVLRSFGWKKFELMIGSTTSVMKIDGVQVATSTAITTANAALIAFTGGGSTGAPLYGAVSQLVVMKYTTNEPTHGAWGAERGLSLGNGPLLRI
jgi:hypothetical protein